MPRQRKIEDKGKPHFNLKRKQVEAMAETSETKAEDEAEGEKPAEPSSSSRRTTSETKPKTRTRHGPPRRQRQAVPASSAGPVQIVVPSAGQSEGSVSEAFVAWPVWK